MFKKNKLWPLIAAALLVTACGGGGGGNSGDKLSGGEGEEIVSGGQDGNPPPSGGENQPPNNPNPNPNPNPGNDPGQNQPQPGEQQLRGHLQLASNQIVYVRPEREWQYDLPNSWYDGAQLEWFENGYYQNGQFEDYISIAAGGTESDLGKEVPPSAIAPAAPIASLGFRIKTTVYSDTSINQPLAEAQVSVGRVAFEFVESPTSVATGETAESMRFVIDRVQIATDASGTIISAQVLAGAQVYVEGVNASGVRVSEILSAPKDSVRILPLLYLHDSWGDESSTVLLLDLEHTFSLAGTRLSALHGLKGLFDTKVTLSQLKMTRPASAGEPPANPALAQKNLVGEPIQVTGQPVVNGAGISGKVWVRRNTLP